MRVRMAIVVDDPKDDSDNAVSELVNKSKEVNCKEGPLDPNFLRAGSRLPPLSLSLSGG
jgi:hypothetical protein